MLPNEKINVTLRKKKKIIFQLPHFTMVGVSIPSDQFSQFSQAHAVFSHYMVSNTKINKQKYPFHYFQIEGCKRYSLWSRIMQFYCFFPLLLFSTNEVQHTKDPGLKPEEGPLVLILLNSSAFYSLNREWHSYVWHFHKMRSQVGLCPIIIKTCIQLQNRVCKSLRPIRSTFTS